MRGAKTWRHLAHTLTHTHVSPVVTQKHPPLCNRKTDTQFCLELGVSWQFDSETRLNYFIKKRKEKKETKHKGTRRKNTTPPPTPPKEKWCESALWSDEGCHIVFIKATDTAELAWCFLTLMPRCRSTSSPLSFNPPGRRKRNVSLLRPKWESSSLHTYATTSLVILHWIKPFFFLEFSSQHCFRRMPQEQWSLHEEHGALWWREHSGKMFIFFFLSFWLRKASVFTATLLEINRVSLTNGEEKREIHVMKILVFLFVFFLLDFKIHHSNMLCLQVTPSLWFWHCTVHHLVDQHE